MKKIIILIFCLFISKEALAVTERKVTVCPSGQGCDYTTLNAAVAGQKDDLVNDDVYLSIEIKGTWSSADTSRPDTATDYVKDATHYINIYTTGDARHQGKYSTSKYHLYNATFADHITASRYTKWDGLQFVESYGSSALVAMTIAVEGDVEIKNSIITSITGDNRQTGIYFNYNGIANTAIIYNNLFINLYTGISVLHASSSAVFYANSFVDSNQGIYAAPGNLLKNNLSVDGTTADYALNSGSWNANNANNLSSDATSPNSTYRDKTITFTDAANGDYSLASTDTDAINAGADLGASYNTDIIGTARPQGAAWDIGAFEYVSATASPFRTMIMRF